MLRGQHHILDPHQLRERRYVFSVELLRVKGFGQLVEVSVLIISRRADQIVTDDAAELHVDRPVNEQSESSVLEPFELCLRIQIQPEFPLASSSAECASSSFSLICGDAIINTSVCI